MFNPLITPEIALMIKRGEIATLEDDADTISREIENMIHVSALPDDLQDEMAAEAAEEALRFSEHLTVQDEPFDLASEIEPSVWNKYLPNDGTPRIEARLRRQGFRKYEDQTREDVQEHFVEVGIIANRRMGRLHILRQKSGDHILS